MAETANAQGSVAENDGALDFILYGPDDKNIFSTVLHLAIPFTAGVLTADPVKGFVRDNILGGNKAKSKQDVQMSHAAQYRDVTPRPAIIEYKE